MYKRLVGLGLLVTLFGVAGCGATLPRTCPVQIGARLLIRVPDGWTLDDEVNGLLTAALRHPHLHDALTLEALHLINEPGAAPLVKSETNLLALSLFHDYVERLRQLRNKGVCAVETGYVEGLYRDFLKLVPPRSAAW